MTLLFAMATFALALSISPGPVNMITLASGLHNGIWRTLPFVTGATTGFTALLYVIGVGGFALLQSYPVIMQVMNVGGTLFILYIGWKLICAGGTLDTQKITQPKFIEGVLLQWLNPKAWIACVSGVAAFVSGEGLGTIGVFCSIYFVLCYLGVGFWAVVGVTAQNLLNTEQKVRGFNRLMGLSLCAVAVYLFMA